VVLKKGLIGVDLQFVEYLQVFFACDNGGNYVDEFYSSQKKISRTTACKVMLEGGFKEGFDNVIPFYYT